MATSTLLDQANAPKPESTVSVPTPTNIPGVSGEGDFIGRDTAREQAVLKELGVNAPTSVPNMKKLLEATYTPAELSKLKDYQTLISQDESLSTLEKQITSLEQGAQAAAPTATKLRPLEKALRAKSQLADPSLVNSSTLDALGKSSTKFQSTQAMMASLGLHSREIQSDYDSFVASINEQAEKFKDVSTGLKAQHDILLSSYNRTFEKVKASQEQYSKALEAFADHQRALELEEVKHNYQKELKRLQAKLDGADGGVNEFGADRGNRVGVGGQFKNLVTSAGTVTAYGSSAWKWGLDVAAKKGTPIVTPGNATVIAARENGGFGNQVQVKFTDGPLKGYQMWTSHLDKFGDVEVGQEVSAGTVLGLMGNTGTVISGGKTFKNPSGDKGTHVDITMKDAEGNFVAPEKVEQLIQTVSVNPKELASKIPFVGDKLAGLLPDKEISSAISPKFQGLAGILENPGTIESFGAAIRGISKAAAVTKIKALVKKNFGKSLSDPEAAQIYEAARVEAESDKFSQVEAIFQEDQEDVVEIVEKAAKEESSKEAKRAAIYKALAEEYELSPIQAKYLYKLTL